MKIVPHPRTVSGHTVGAGMYDNMRDKLTPTDYVSIG